MAAAVTGVVFDIRELTIHDGPGIRTTVFLKGCHLRCAWCHNPEGLSPEPGLMRSALGDRLAGQSYSSAELAGILNRQAPILREIGGVTFSGGEPLMQADFVAQTIDQLDGLHVALGTAGFAPEADFQRVARRCHLVLFDLKLMDPVAHRYWTGHDNDLILANLSWLEKSAMPFVIRVPLVPGVTDTDENMNAIAARVKSLSCRPRVELLPYNCAAGGKYAACGLEWRPGFEENRPVNHHLETFVRSGIEASLI
jgi:pyruvate formate lyase activating enzyme